MTKSNIPVCSKCPHPFQTITSSPPSQNWHIHNYRYLSDLWHHFIAKAIPEKGDTSINYETNLITKHCKEKGEHDPICN